METTSFSPAETGEDRPDATGPRAGTRQAALLMAGTAMPILGAVLLAPVLPAMTTAFASTPGVEVLVPVVLTIPALAIALLAPFAGAVADRVGRKNLLIVAMVLYSLFGTAPLWLDSLGAIVASRVGVGVAEAAILTCCTTLITDYYTGKQRDKYLGMQVLVASLSATVFFGLGGALGNFGWRMPFWLYASAALIAVPMAFGLWEPTKGIRTAGPSPVPWRQIAVPSAVTLFGGVVFYALIVQLPYILTDLGVANPGMIGAGTALASAATAAGALSFRFFSDAGPARLLPVAFGLAAVGLVLVSVASSVPAALIGAMVTSAGTGLLLPTLLTWAVSGLRLEQRGRGTGIWTGSLQFGQFFSPIALAVVASLLGGLPLALGVLGALAAIAAVAVAVARPQRHAEEPSPEAPLASASR